METKWDLHSKLVVAAGITETLRHAKVDIDASQLVVRPVELPATARQADLLFATADGSVVVQVEVQHRRDPGMALRMTGYAARIAEDPAYRERLRDLVQIVVQVTGGAMDTGFRLGALSNRFRLVHIPSVPVAELLGSPGLAPFAMVRGGPQAVAPMVGRIAEAGDTGLRASMVALAIALAPSVTGVIMDRLRRDDMTDVITELAKTDWGRGLIAQGRDEGRLAGREEGREEGRREALVADVADVLAVRFPRGAPASVGRTALRLIAETAHPIREALVLDQLDSDN